MGGEQREGPTLQPGHLGGFTRKLQLHPRQGDHRPIRQSQGWGRAGGGAHVQCSEVSRQDLPVSLTWNKDNWLGSWSHCPWQIPEGFRGEAPSYNPRQRTLPLVPPACSVYCYFMSLARFPIQFLFISSSI